jgi:hypothetical protein
MQVYTNFACNDKDHELLLLLATVQLALISLFVRLNKENKSPAGTRTSRRVITLHDADTTDSLLTQAATDDARGPFREFFLSDPPVDRTNEIDQKYG